MVNDGIKRCGLLDDQPAGLHDARAWEWARWVAGLFHCSRTPYQALLFIGSGRVISRLVPHEQDDDEDGRHVSKMRITATDPDSSVPGNLRGETSRC